MTNDSHIHDFNYLFIFIIPFNYNSHVKNAVISYKSFQLKILQEINSTTTTTTWMSTANEGLDK